MVRGIYEDKREIKDQLGSLPEKNLLGMWNYNETLKVEDGAIIVEDRAVNTGTMIWDHSSKGEWNDLDWGDGTYDSSKVIQHVFNPNNIFHEHFRDTTFKDSSNTDATWDISNYYINFSASHKAQTTSIFLNSEPILTAKPTITIDSGSVSIYLSRDAGVSWGIFTNNTSEDFSNVTYMLDDFKRIGDWQNSFDGTDAESIATISDRTGFKTITQLYGEPHTILNDCEDHTSGFTVAGGASVSTNVTTFKHGSAAVNLIDAAGSSLNPGVTATFSATNFGDTTRKITMWVYIKDQTMLDKINYLRLVCEDGSGNTGSFRTTGTQMAHPSIGWNYYRITPSSPDDTGGAYDSTDVVSVELAVFKNAEGDTWAAGDVIMDQIRRYTQAGYGAALNESYNGVWTGHTTADTIGFYFYCPDSTKYNTLELSFGDDVAGVSHVKASNLWSVSGGDIVDGWNYLSLALSGFTLFGGYTIDFSDIAEARFTTRYAGSTTDVSPYEDDETQDYYFSDLAFETQSGTPTVKNDLRLKLVEDEASTARVSEIKVKYTI